MQLYSAPYNLINPLNISNAHNHTVIAFALFHQKYSSNFPFKPPNLNLLLYYNIKRKINILRFTSLYILTSKIKNLFYCNQQHQNVSAS